MKNFNPTRIIFLCTFLFLASCGKGTENENGSSTSGDAKSAPKKVEMSSYTGTYTYGNGEADKLSGQLEIHAQEGPDKQSEFSIFVGDNHSTGYVHGALNYHGDGEFTFETSEDGMDCKMIFKFSGERVTVSYLEGRTQCAQKGKLSFNGTFTKTSGEKPDFSEDYY